MGQVEIRHVHGWAAECGEVANKFHQGLPEVDKVLQPLRNDCENFAICYALCVKWLIDRANGHDFWSRIYDTNGTINNETIQKLANRQLLATGLHGEVAEMERRFTKNGIREARVKQTSPPQPAPRSDSRSRPIPAPRDRPTPAPRPPQNKTTAAGIQLRAKVVRSLSSVEPVFQTIRISYADDAEAAGHMMAAVVGKSRAFNEKHEKLEKADPPIIFFDPNFGEFAFADETGFKTFFDKGLWPVYAKLYGFDASRVRCFKKTDPELADTAL